MKLLILNAGSSSLKFAVYDGLAQKIEGRCRELAPCPGLRSWASPPAKCPR